MIVLLVLNVIFFGDDTLSGSNQIALLLAATFAGIIAIHLGFKWEYILKTVVKSINTAMPAMIILLLIGSVEPSPENHGKEPRLSGQAIKPVNNEISYF